MIGLLFGEKLIVGLEDDVNDGSLRVYVNARYTGIHTHLADESQKAKVRDAYAGTTHLTTKIPDEALCDCPNEVSVA